MSLPPPTPRSPQPEPTVTGTYRSEQDRPSLWDRRSVALYAAVLAVFALVTVAVAYSAATFAGSGSDDDSTGQGAGQVAVSQDERIAHQADVAIGQTLIAAIRLGSFSEAANSRRAGILKKTEQNLDAATAALASLDSSTMATEAEQATARLEDLTAIVTGLRGCLREDSRKTGKNAKGQTKNPQECVIKGSDVETARSAGATVALLLPLASVTDEELAALNVTASEEALVEGEKGSRSRITVPDAFLP